MSFFNRFAARQRPVQDQEQSDIIENLNHILNSKKGYGAVLRDFGIRDLAEFNDEKQVTNAVMKEVTRNIQAFEPRIEVREIESVKSESIFQLSFKLDCVLKEKRQSLNMIFDTVSNSITVEDGR